MLTIISPKSFKTIPWKNGLGKTIELAINNGGTLSNFDWRISIASVESDGVFSDFSGYFRHLVLIKGNGISLKHDNNKIDQLDCLLELASFDGGCETMGRLHSGAITDFNIMTNDSFYSALVKTYLNQQTVSLTSAALCFAYSLSGNIKVKKSSGKILTLPKGHLLKIEADNKADMANNNLTGENMILVQIKKLN